MAATDSLVRGLRRGNSSQVLIVEAAAGNRRRRWLEHRLREMAPVGSRTWMVSCDFDMGGPWAGVRDLLGDMFPEIQAERPDLIAQHTLELTYVLPHLRRSVVLRNPTLTDLASPEERSRNYPSDGALRIVHGLIDLLDGWKAANGAETPWIICCDSYCRAGTIGANFFRELARRRGKRLNIQLLIAVEPGRAEAVRSSFHSSVAMDVSAIDLPADAPGVFAPDIAAQQACELEKKIGDDPIERQIALPELVRLWSSAGRHDKVVRYRYFGLETYNVQGLYA